MLSPACPHRPSPRRVCQCSGCHGAIVRNMEPQPPDISSNYSDMACRNQTTWNSHACLPRARPRRVQKRSGWHGGVGHNIESPRTVHGTPTPGRDSRFNGWHGDESNVDSQACPPRTFPRPLQSLAQGEAKRHNLHGCAGGCFFDPSRSSPNPIHRDYTSPKTNYPAGVYNIHYPRHLPTT